MNLSKLPYDVIGQVGPILSWVESDDGVPLPDSWTSRAQPFKDRENAWMLRELPTYSYDNVEEIVIGTRFRYRRSQVQPARLPFLEDHRRSRLDPPHGYDLLFAFRRLNEHFMVWNGTEPCIRSGLMEELHELALRMPAGHIVRHGHARAVAEGVISMGEALELPENVTLLPSNSFGLRGVVRRGLSESHLHLSSVTSAEETWADSLLKPITSSSIRGGTPQERRLLVLNLYAGRLLALAIWLSLLKEEKETAAKPEILLSLLDRLYFARDTYSERFAAKRLQEAIKQAVYGSLEPQSKELDRLEGRHSEILKELKQHRKPEAKDSGRGLGEWHDRHKQLDRALDEARWKLEDKLTDQRARSTAIARKVPESYRFLLRWISPTAWRIQQIGRQAYGALPESLPETLEDRHRLVHRLHLAAHLRLVQMSTRAKAGEPDRRSPADRQGTERSRHFLHRALFRYLVCRTHHWQLATQQGRTTGLRHFKRFFASPHRRPKNISDLQKAELVFDRLRTWRGLRVLEGRVSPPKSTQELVPWVLAYARPEDRRIQKFGLVVHFKKELESQEDPLFKDPRRSPAPRLRWGRRRRRVRDQGMKLYRLLRRPTPITPFIVGIDACNLELATPPEVFAPVFRFLREFPISLTGDPRHFAPYLDLDSSIRTLVENRRLGMTYHVGEDFRHLLSGLRAICEVVDFLEPQPGDRLGHGTALALSPEKWLAQNGYQAVMPKLEWLDTLVWVHHFLGPGDDLIGQLAIEDQIQALSTEIYSRALSSSFDPLRLSAAGRVWRGRERRRQQGPRRRGLMDWDWSPLTLWDAWLMRQLDPYSIDLPALFEGRLEMHSSWTYTEEQRRWQSVQERIIRSVRREIGSRNAFVVLGLYWLDPEVRRRGDDIMIVHMHEKRDLWLELCRRVEDRMEKLILEKELVVEVNPSSNRIIGPMTSYDQHHVFELTLDENDRLRRGVRVSVNTDNPAVCNTTLAHEHYLVGEILIARGVPEAEVVEWLEWLRQNGEDYNFVRRLESPEESPHMRRLLTWLRGIRKSVREARTREEKNHAFWTWLRETRLRALGFDDTSIRRDSRLIERLLSLEGRLRKASANASKSIDELGLQVGDASGAPARAETLLERLERLEQLVSELSPPTTGQPD